MNPLPSSRTRSQWLETRARPPLIDLRRLLRLLASTRRDLVAARALADLAQQRSQCDNLTGLANRQGFACQTRISLAKHLPLSQVCALLFIDLDGFKSINDRLGHAAGDRLLQIVGARLAHAMRAGDTVSRHGGDEFLCLLPQLHSEARALSIAEQLVGLIAAPCELDGVRVSVRPSIGLAFYPRDGATLELLLAHADLAMYTAKRGGGGVASPPEP